MPALGLSDKIQYRFCSGTQLQRFYFQLSWPFAYWILSAPNYPSCVPAVTSVCDIALGIATVVKPSTPTAMDGSITITATSSQSSIRYSLTNVPWQQMSNTTGVFTGLGIGNYTIYTSDIISCRATMNIVIGEPLVATVNNGVIYRQEYNDYFGKQTRVDILKKGYSGGITAVKSAGEPIGLRLRGENGSFFDTILASEMTQNLISETNFEFVSLYTDDDRKYQVIYYKDLGSGLTELWRGFVVPALYSEPYNRDTNYPIAIQSTDQLSSLKDLDFRFDSGEKITGTYSLIALVSLILLKTDLLLPIRVAINIYDSGMSSGTSDDPLNQANIDASTYDGMSCADVLNNIIGAFGACIRQWGGYWIIRRRAEETGLIYYRQFSAYGVYVSSSSETITNTSWKWEGQNQVLEMMGARGTVNITQNLKIDPYYFRNGGFENALIQGFVLIINGNNAYFTTVGPGNNSNVAIKINSDSTNNTYTEDAYLWFAKKGIILDGSESLKFSFDFFPYNLNGTIPYPFVKFKASFRVGSYYLQSDGSWSSSNQWIEIVATAADFNKWNTFEITAQARTAEITDTDIRVMHGSGPTVDPIGRTWYFANDAALKAKVTVGLSPGYISTIHEESINADLITRTLKTRYYKLRQGTDADNSPLILRPTDYNGATNPQVWENITGQTGYAVYGYTTYNGVLNPQTVNGYTGYVRIFDNIALQVMPGGSQMPSSKTFSITSTLNVKKTLDLTFDNGDAPVEIINGQYSFINIFKLSSGVATKLWTRRGSNTNASILGLLGLQIAEQTYTPKYKLTGTIRGTSNSFFGFNTSLSEYGKYYALAGMTIRDKMCSYDVEVYQINPEIANGIIGEFATAEFTLTEFGTSIRFNS